MILWYSASSQDEAMDFSALGAVPLELDPRWLSSRVDSSNKYVQYFLVGDKQHPSGYAPFFVHPGALSYCLGETTVFHIPVLRYALQAAPLCENQALLAGL